jgi:hypothetical protein
LETEVVNIVLGVTGNSKGKGKGRLVQPGGRCG